MTITAIVFPVNGGAHAVCAAGAKEEKCASVRERERNMAFIRGPFVLLRAFSIIQMKISLCVRASLYRIYKTMKTQKRIYKYII